MPGEFNIRDINTKPYIMCTQISLNERKRLKTARRRSSGYRTLRVHRLKIDLSGSGETDPSTIEPMLFITACHLFAGAIARLQTVVDFTDPGCCIVPHCDRCGACLVLTQYNNPGPSSNTLQWMTVELVLPCDFVRELYGLIRCHSRYAGMRVGVE